MSGTSRLQKDFAAKEALEAGWQAIKEQKIVLDARLKELELETKHDGYTITCDGLQEDYRVNFPDLTLEQQQRIEALLAEHTKKIIVVAEQINQKLYFEACQGKR